jgi:hypothetical protein
MSDIFISYAREDKSRVQTLAKALEDSGWSVWWDPHIPTGKRFDEVIEQAISAAKCIIVVWSKNSVSSTFVRAEASDGADRQVLLPVMIDDVKIPLAFRQIQTVRLIDWQGSTQDAEFVKLVNDISVLTGKDSTLPPTTVSTVEPDPSPIKETAKEAAKEAAKEKGPFKVSKGLILAGVAAAALLIVLFVWNYQKSTTGTVNPPVERSPEQTPTPTPLRTEDNSIKSVSDLVKHIRVKRLGFFEGDCPPRPPEGSFGMPSIQNDRFGRTRWFFDFEHPKASRQIGFQIFARFLDSEGDSRGVMKLEKALIKPNSTYSWFCSEQPRPVMTLPLSRRPVSLPAGSYKVEVFFRESEREVARKVHEISIGLH